MSRIYPTLFLGKCMISVDHLLCFGPFIVFFEIRKNMYTGIVNFFGFWPFHEILHFYLASGDYPFLFLFLFLLWSHVLLLRAFLGNLLLLPHEMICNVTFPTRTVTVFVENFRPTKLTFVCVVRLTFTIWWSQFIAVPIIKFDVLKFSIRLVDPQNVLTLAVSSQKMCIGNKFDLCLCCKVNIHHLVIPVHHSTM